MGLVIDHLDIDRIGLYPASKAALANWEASLRLDDRSYRHKLPRWLESYYSRPLLQLSHKTLQSTSAGLIW